MIVAIPDEPLCGIGQDGSRYGAGMGGDVNRIRTCPPASVFLTAWVIGIT
jgi:hypothetical protein